MSQNKSDFAFFHPLRVRWGECDAQGIVFFVNYLIFFDVAVTEYFRELGFEFTGENALELYTVHASTDYTASAHFDEEIEVGIRCSRLGKTSMTCAYAIFREGEFLVEGKVTYVHAIPKTKSKTPLPDALVERICAFEVRAPERNS